LRTIEEYDIEKDEWRILPFELQTGLTNSAALAINTRSILVFGGG
jgi:N-acetylneuraminic acid mutarotase